jgi:hypothetical protein
MPRPVYDKVENTGKTYRVTWREKVTGTNEVVHFKTEQAAKEWANSLRNSENAGRYQDVKIERFSGNRKYKNFRVVFTDRGQTRRTVVVPAPSESLARRQVMRAYGPYTKIISVNVQRSPE